MKGFIGIDPGVNGGICFESPNGIVSAHGCPATLKDMVDLIKEQPNYNGDYLAVIENVHSMPGQGVASTFKFGKNFGEWLAILASLGIPYVEISPQKWQKHFSGMPTKKKGEKASKFKTRRKNHLKHLAQQRHPDLKVTLKTADAILLKVYAKEVAWAQ